MYELHTSPKIEEFSTFFFFHDCCKRPVHLLLQHLLQYFCCQLQWIAALPNMPLLKDDHMVKDFLLEKESIELVISCQHFVQVSLGFDTFLYSIL